MSEDRKTDFSVTALIRGTVVAGAVGGGVMGMNLPPFLHDCHPETTVAFLEKLSKPRITCEIPHTHQDNGEQQPYRLANAYVSATNSPSVFGFGGTLDRFSLT